MIYASGPIENLLLQPLTYVPVNVIFARLEQRLRKLMVVDNFGQKR